MTSNSIGWIFLLFHGDLSSGRTTNSCISIGNFWYDLVIIVFSIWQNALEFCIICHSRNRRHGIATNRNRRLWSHLEKMLVILQDRNLSCSFSIFIILGFQIRPLLLYQMTHAIHWWRLKAARPNVGQIELDFLPRRKRNRDTIYIPHFLIITANRHVQISFLFFIQ